MDSLSDYAHLQRPDETGLPLVWGVWGEKDQLGTLNNITEGTVQAAAGLIQRGARFNLDLPLQVPYAVVHPDAHQGRAPVQTIDTRETAGLPVRDDRLDSLYLQGSSQWDGLTHIGDPRHGFYNAVQPQQITGGEGTRNGIENMAEFCIAGRAVSADLSRHFSNTGHA